MSAMIKNKIGQKIENKGDGDYFRVVRNSLFEKTTFDQIIKLSKSSN